MVRTKDLAARLARIKEQENRKLGRKVLPIPPRRRGLRMRGSSSEPFGLLIHRPLAFGGAAAIALTLYALSPANEEVSASAAAPQVLHIATNSLAVSEEVLRDELDRRAARLAYQERDDTASVFEVPKDMKRFVNEDGSLTQLAREMVKDAEEN